MCSFVVDISDTIEYCSLHSPTDSLQRDVDARLAQIGSRPLINVILSLAVDHVRANI